MASKIPNLLPNQWMGGYTKMDMMKPYIIICMFHTPAHLRRPHPLPSKVVRNEKQSSTITMENFVIAIINCILPYYVGRVSVYITSYCCVSIDQLKNEIELQQVDYTVFSKDKKESIVVIIRSHDDVDLLFY